MQRSILSRFAPTQILPENRHPKRPRVNSYGLFWELLQKSQRVDANWVVCSETSEFRINKKPGLSTVVEGVLGLNFFSLGVEPEIDLSPIFTSTLSYPRETNVFPPFKATQSRETSFR